MKSTNDPAAEIPAAHPQPASKPRHRGGNTKRTGELSEAAFLLKAQHLGFKVAKPWGDSERYDFILDTGSRLWRVQVKCTARLRAGGYDVQPVHTDQTHKAHYTSGDIDFLVANIIPLDLWYIVPVAVIAPGMSLRFYPDGNCRRPRFEKFREAWHLLGPPTSDSVHTTSLNNAGKQSAVIHEEEEQAAEQDEATEEREKEEKEEEQKHEDIEEEEERAEEQKERAQEQDKEDEGKEKEEEENYEEEEEKEGKQKEKEETGQNAPPPQPELKWTPIWRPSWNPKIFGR